MKDFIQYLQQKNLSKSTQDYYQLYIDRFLYWLDKDIIDCTKKDILRYLAYLKNHKNQANITRRNNLIALNHYFTFLLQNNDIANNPTALIKIRGTKKKMLYNIYSFDELEQLNDNFHHVFIRNFDDNHIPKNQRKQAYLSRQRNYVLFSLLIYQGLITSELQKINLNDIDLIKATIHIKGRTKGEQRTMSLNASQIGALMQYVQNIRPQFLAYRTQETNQLFLPLPESGKTTNNSTQISGLIKPLSKQARSIDSKFVNFKQIRASVITYWIKTYGLRKAQYLAGHRHINSTENYLPNDLESLTDDMAKFNPF